MTRYAAFLRGINVSGRRISGEELRACVERLGFRDVATFRASGNVILTDEAGAEPEAVASRIQRGLAEALGYEVPTFLRTAREVRAIARHEPFAAAAVAASDGKLQVALLLRKPSATARRKAVALGSDRDRLALRGRELYWLPSGGILDSSLDRSALASLLGTTTMRTKGTIDLLAAKHFAT